MTHKCVSRHAFCIGGMDSEPVVLCNVAHDGLVQNDGVRTVRGYQTDNIFLPTCLFRPTAMSFCRTERSYAASPRSMGVASSPAVSNWRIPRQTWQRRRGESAPSPKSALSPPSPSGSSPDDEQEAKLIASWHRTKFLSRCILLQTLNTRGITIPSRKTQTTTAWRTFLRQVFKLLCSS